MGKKILVLNGSRNKGNTSVLIESFKESAEGVGNTVSCFHLQEMNIRGCVSCKREDEENACSIFDDMNQIYPLFKEADIVIMVSPMYFWSISGHLKCACDRLFIMTENDENKGNTHKGCALIISSEKPSNASVESAKEFYNTVLNETGWSDMGRIYTIGGSDIEAQSSFSALEEVRKFGASIK